ncbi:hypothetical protein DRW03_31845 [Corallococcus sp. H22C18031201]|nr:hypothetical protein DRW03_31845 [Corallococcus sp. H22C18031201]
MTLHVLGIRHHSPGCARVVRQVIREVRPRHVLIEGPSDMNARWAELRLGHRLPIAVFTYLHIEGRSRASWSPFCAGSPEWVALEAAEEVGAEARFIDLPAWHDVFTGVTNRFADRRGEAGRERTRLWLEALLRHYRLDDEDALWDHLFELPCDAQVLRERLRQYFALLRGDAPGGPRDGPREDFMADAVAWAEGDVARRADGRDGVVVVCGGFHAPALEHLARGRVRDRFPVAPPPASGARWGSFLVPYDSKQMDAFAGYDAGMPSPGFYALVHEHGPEVAAEALLTRVARRLRDKGQPVSTADLIAARTHAEGLARLRGHAALARTDVLDGLSAALVKEGLEVPPPWAGRGPLPPRTEPLFVEMVAALAGDARGELDARTPHPPLVRDVADVLRKWDLEPASPSRPVKLVLTESEAREKSRVLHRLRVLGIPGFARSQGPSTPTGVVLEERWDVGTHPEQLSALIQAGAHGATLESAAWVLLEERLLQAEGRLGALADTLLQAVFVGLEGLALEVVGRAAGTVGTESSLGELGAALGTLLDVWHHGVLLGAARAPQLEPLVTQAVDRGLWLLEGAGSTAEGRVVAAVVALRDALRAGPDRARALDVRADGVWTRKTLDAAAAPEVRGACLGALWSLGRFVDGAAEVTAVRAMQALGLPATLGDFLAGLAAVARAQMLQSQVLLGSVHDVVKAMTEADFLTALPALRLAFSFFPPMERATLARTVLRLEGADEGAAHTLLALDMEAGQVARGMALETRARALAARWGLSDAADSEVRG